MTPPQIVVMIAYVVAVGLWSTGEIRAFLRAAPRSHRATVVGMYIGSFITLLLFGPIIGLQYLVRRWRAGIRR